MLHLAGLALLSSSSTSVAAESALPRSDLDVPKNLHHFDLEDDDTSRDLVCSMSSGPGPFSTGGDDPSSWFSGDMS